MGSPMPTLVAPNLIFPPSLERALVQERIVVTVPRGVGQYRTPKDQVLGLPLGVPVDDIPQEHRFLQMVLQHAADKAIERLRIRGYEYWDPDDIHVYGPYDSKQTHNRLLTPQALNVAPEVVAGMVRNREDDATLDEVDYLLVANFVKQAVRMEDGLEHASLPKELTDGD